MVGRDHSVMVLEVAGESERGLLEPHDLRQTKPLPAACEWLFSSWSSWFRTQPQLMYAAQHRIERVFALVMRA